MFIHSYHRLPPYEGFIPSLTTKNCIFPPLHHQNHVIGSLHLIQAVCLFHDIEEGKVVIHLDVEKAMQLSSDTYPLDPTQSCFDLLLAICRVRDKLPIRLKWEWVEGIRTMPENLSTLVKRHRIIVEQPITRTYYRYNEETPYLHTMDDRSAEECWNKLWFGWQTKLIAVWELKWIYQLYHLVVQRYQSDKVIEVLQW